MLLSKSLGLQSFNQIGIIGKYNKKKVKRTFKNFNISNVEIFHSNTLNSNLEKKSHKILSFLKKNNSFENIKLPENFPIEIFHDGILKRQRRASINFNDKALLSYIQEFLIDLENAKHIINKYKPKLIILSHAVNFKCGSLAWIAYKQKISSIVIYGVYGSLRFWRFSKYNQVFMDGNFLTENEIKKLTQNKKKTRNNW